MPFSAYHIRFFSLISPLFPYASQCPRDKIFLHVSIDSIRSVQEILVHTTYVPFHQLPSVGLSVFVRRFSCTRRTYHFTNYQVWGFPFLSDFRARNVRAISPTTKCGASRFFRARDVRTSSTDNTGARSGSPQLYETCMFHSKRKYGPCKHIMGLFKALSYCHACIS